MTAEQAGHRLDQVAFVCIPGSSACSRVLLVTRWSCAPSRIALSQRRGADPVRPSRLPTQRYGAETAKYPYGAQVRPEDGPTGPRSCTRDITHPAFPMRVSPRSGHRCSSCSACRRPAACLRPVDDAARDGERGERDGECWALYPVNESCGYPLRL